MPERKKINQLQTHYMGFWWKSCAMYAYAKQFRHLNHVYVLLQWSKHQYSVLRAVTKTSSMHFGRNNTFCLLYEIWNIYIELLTETGQCRVVPSFDASCCWVFATVATLYNWWQITQLVEEKSQLECQSNELSKSLTETQHKLTAVDSGEKTWSKSITVEQCWR